MKPNEENAETQAIKSRRIRDVPFCWQAKAILKVIDEIFDASNDVASARSVYLALTQIASNEQSETFTRRIGEIARRASASYSTTARILKRFETLKIIAVQRNRIEGTKELSASTYTLGNGYLTLGNDRIRASLPRVQKNLRTGTARRGESSEESGHRRTGIAR